MLSDEQLFNFFESARNLTEYDDDETVDGVDNVDNVDDVNNVMNVDETTTGTDDATGNGVQVIQLTDGTFHVCKGRACPHVTLTFNATEKEYVCGLSGQIVAQTLETSNSLSWSGRSVGSSDPDALNAGCLQGGWKTKRDAFAVSANAWSRANEIEIDDVEEDSSIYQAPSSSKDAKAVKRGAPCVTLVTESKLEIERNQKSLKRVASLANQATLDRLRKDASSVVSKLLSLPIEENKPETLQKQRAKEISENSTPVAHEAASLDDPRLQNYDFVFLVGLRRYLAKCNQSRCLPCLDTVHNVAIAASNFTRARKRAAKRKRESTVDKHALKKLATNGQTIELCAALVCALWLAVSSTTPFKQSQLGDSFRPFAAGVLYCFRNGVSMPDCKDSGNTEDFELIPKIDLIANQLPTLRTSSGNHTARQLQSASHKGVSAIHRALASVPELEISERREVMTKFKHAARIGFKLLEYVSTQLALLSKPVL